MDYSVSGGVSVGARGGLGVDSGWRRGGLGVEKGTQMADQFAGVGRARRGEADGPRTDR